jgi:cytochrome c oxidase subunit 2
MIKLLMNWYFRLVKPVRLILTSKDVLHSFYMPHFRVQLNTVPGMTSYFEFTPTITTEKMKAEN